MKKIKLYLFTWLIFSIYPILALYAQEKISIDTFTCGAGWGKDYCKPQKINVDLYIPKNSFNAPLVILQHGSGGINTAVTEKIQLLTNRNYVVAINDAFTSRGISKSHFDYAGTAANGGNARSMAIDSLAIILALQNDKRINVTKTAIIGFSQGGLVSYWLKSDNFLQSIAVKLLGNLIQPKLVIAMYGCSGEFNENFQFNNLPVEVVVGDQDPVLKKCYEFKKRLVSSRQPANVNITVLKNAYHGFDENYLRKIWPKNQEVENCYTLRKLDGSVENPFIGKSYEGQNIEKQIINDCIKYGQYAGNNGDPKIGDQPILNALEKYVKPN